jgi:ribosome production factor 2
MLQVEDPRRSLLVHGNRTSQVIKDVLVDLHKMKGVGAAHQTPPALLRASGVRLPLCRPWPPRTCCITDDGLPLLAQVDSVKFSRNNPDMRPFEAGGEASLELQCSRNNCSLFALGSHQKKRPHNLILGRLYDFRLYDAVEFGVRQYRSVQSFGGGAAQAQLGNKVGVGRSRVASIHSSGAAPCCCCAQGAASAWGGR